MTKSIGVVYDILDENLFISCQDYSKKMLLTAKNSYTNHSWEKKIVKDSNPVIINQLDSSDSLYKKIEDTISVKLQIKNIKSILFYYWTQNSHIPWHTDPNDNGGITIYLNEVWDKDSGGIFLFETNNGISGIYPKKNMSVVQKGGVPYCVSPTSRCSDIRYTIQIFF